MARSETNLRENNEDSHLALVLPIDSGRSVVLLAVADGMGGHAYGELASREGLRRFGLALFEQVALRPALSTSGPTLLDYRSLADAIRDSIVLAHDHVARMARNNRWGRSGSTLVVAALLGDTVVVSNLGDSPAFLVSEGEAKARQVTVEHTMTSEMVRQGRLSPEMAEYHEGRHSLVYHLGCDSLPSDLPLFVGRLAPGDTLCLCSDGISGSLSAGHIADIVRAAGGDLDRAASDLVDQACSAGSEDNQTVILWRHTGVTEDLARTTKVCPPEEVPSPAAVPEANCFVTSVLRPSSALVVVDPEGHETRNHDEEATAVAEAEASTWEKGPYGTTVLRPASKDSRGGSEAGPPELEQSPCATVVLRQASEGSRGESEGSPPAPEQSAFQTVVLQKASEEMRGEPEAGPLDPGTDPYATVIFQVMSDERGGELDASPPVPFHGSHEPTLLRQRYDGNPCVTRFVRPSSDPEEPTR